MKYQPVTEKEFNERMLLPAGEYAFEVLNATEGVSKSSGADMITLELLVHATDGGSRKVKSYLVGSEKGRFQVRAFCVSAGILAKYDAGTFGAEDCLGKSGWLRLRVEAGKAKEDGSGNWPDKNSVAGFIAEPSKAKASTAAPSAQPAPKTAPAPQSDINEEDVPF